VIASVSLLTSLAACAHSDRVQVGPVNLPPIPTHLRTCLGPVSDLPEGSWNAAQTASVIARVRASELRRTRCGQELIRWYDDLRSKL
jgi:hypothetical protein